jgi:2-polyprenyl-3-methyl-5-hydroxy-6-metoxy-1,4-benzoquinol methylase
MSQAFRPENLVNGYVERGVPGAAGWWSMHADHLARYYHAAGMVTGRRVLDAGTGPGYGAALLKVSGAADVEAIDIDEATIRWAEREYGSVGVRFTLDDCETLSRVTGQFDVICNFENIEHLKQPEAFLQAAARRLAPGGVLLCSSPDRAAPEIKWLNDRPNNPHHMNEWYAEEFQSILSKYFRTVDVKRQVESVSVSSRKEAVRHLSQHLIYLWSSPFARLARAVRSVVGKRPVWSDISGLAAPTVADYPIVPAAIAGAVGQPKCLYAVCHDPVI